MVEAVAAMIDARVRCTRQPAQAAIRNAKFLSSQAETVRCIARSASQSVRVKSVRRRDFLGLSFLV